MDNIYIWVFLVNIESFLLLALNICFVAILLKTVFCCIFWRQKILILWRKIAENLIIIACLFCPKNGAIDFTKILITQERLVVESCPTPRWIAFLMHYQVVYNISTHFSELILAWSAYLKSEWKQTAGGKESNLSLCSLWKIAWFFKQ